MMSRERPNDLGAFWLPFTPNRDFKARPRMLARAEGHVFLRRRRPRAARRVLGAVVLERGPRPQGDRRRDPRAAHALDFAPTFQFAHPGAFVLAERIAALAPKGLDHVFFVNSGSEAADAALKIARAYWQQDGPGRPLPPDRAREGLSRRDLRRHLGRRPRQQPQALRPASSGYGRSPAAALRSRRRWRSRAASRKRARTMPTRSMRLSRCTAPRPSPRSSSSRWRARPACSRRRRTTCKRLRAACDRHGILLDLRRGDHRLRTGGCRVRRRALRRRRRT